jgi:hypothetical protein
MELAHLLQERSYFGTFEAHITILSADLATRTKFRELCHELAVKCILIELPEGMTRGQPMTASYYHGNLQDVLAQVYGLAQTFANAGFKVTRIKVEAMTNNQDIPESDEEAQALPASNYFEFHVKVTLPADSDLVKLQAQCQKRGGHLSANAFKYQRGGQQQRFVTMRLYGVGRQSAEARFNELLQWLEGEELKLSHKLREYTVYDTNVALDAGWIDTQGLGRMSDEND